MVDRLIYTGKMLGLGGLGLFIMFLPVLLAMAYHETATNGRSSFPPDEYDRINSRTFWIVVLGYLILVSTFLFVTAPV